MFKTSRLKLTKYCARPKQTMLTINSFERKTNLSNASLTMKNTNHAQYILLQFIEKTYNMAQVKAQ